MSNFLEKVSRNSNKVTQGVGSVNDVLNTDLGALFGQPNKMSVDALKARIESYASPNRFMIVLTAPKTISQYYSTKAVEVLCTLVREVNLPSQRIGTFDHRERNLQRQLPNDVIYAPVTMSFYLDQEMRVRKFFQDWINTITTNNNKTFNYLEEYAVNIQIIKLDHRGKPMYTVELQDAYPTVLADSALSAEAENQLMTQNVTFSYHKWREVNPNSLEDNTIGGILNSVTGGLSGTITERLNNFGNLSKKAGSLSNRFG